jgi:hypothetical protein
MLEVMIVLVAAVIGLFRHRRSLLAENALLRHQLAIVRRSVLMARTTRPDRLGLVVLAELTPLACGLPRPQSLFTLCDDALQWCVPSGAFDYEGPPCVGPLVLGVVLWLGSG